MENIVLILYVIIFYNKNTEHKPNTYYTLMYFVFIIFPLGNFEEQQSISDLYIITG